MRIAALVLVFALSALTPSDADACGAPLCTDEHRFSPGPGEQVPENVEALVLSVMVPMEDGGVTLRDSNGGVVPVTLSQTPGTVLVRPAALDPGAYSVEFPSQCDTTTVTSSFVVGPTEPSPVDAGVFGLVDSKWGTVLTENDATCTADITAAWARLGFVPSAELGHYLPVTNAILLVDGEAWADADWGDLLANGLLSRAEPRNVLLPYAACGEVGSGSDPGLELGAHDAELQLFIAGRQAPLSVGPVSFTLSCDGGTGDAPAVIGSPSDPPPTFQEQPPEGSIDATSGCGCTAAPMAPALFFLLALLTLIRRGSSSRAP